MSGLTNDELRALRILAERPAHELESTPLRTVGRLVDLGLARITERYRTPRHGIARKIEITEAGRASLPRPSHGLEEME